MQQYRKNLGKVSLTAEGAWNRSKDYEILSIIYEEHTNHGFISRKDVPKGVDITNKEYWMPLNVSGYADNNMIILSKRTSESAIESYTLEEAVKSIASVGRRPGTILGFYNENSDRMDIGGCWELWQYNGVDVADWENLNSWNSIYYNYNKFVGWYRNEDILKKYVPFPEIGCYAYVGSDLNDAVIYRCDRKYAWTNTTEHVWNYFKVIVGGNVTVGENGNWFNNGVDTNIPASVKGENGKTPIIRNNDNVLEVSYDNVNWEPISDEVAVWARVNNNKLEITKHKVGGWEVVSDYIAAWFRWQSQGGQQAFSTGKIQITRNGITWTDLSGEFVNNLRISRYIGADESLPTSGIVEGTIYAKGPYYEDDDTNHDYPAYRIWVYAWKGNTLAWVDHGQFTSIAAGIVQETGDSEVAVMSQKAVTEKLSELGSYVENPEYARAYTDAEDRFLWGIKQDGSIEWAKGVPTPIKNYIESLDLENDEEIERINQLIIGLIADVKVLTDTYHYVSNAEWACAIIDSEDRILMGIKANGEIYIPNRDLCRIESSDEYVKAVVDLDGRVLFGIKKDGSCFIPKGISDEAKKGIIELTTRMSFFEDFFSGEENTEWISVSVDADGRVLGGRKNNGKIFESVGVDLNGCEFYLDKSEEMSEVKTDLEWKIISYRQADGTKVENVGLKTKRLHLGSEAVTDVIQSLNDASYSPNNYNIKEYRLPKFGVVDIVSEIFYLTADSRYSSKDDIEVRLDYEDNDSNAQKKITVASYYIKNTDIKLDFYAATLVSKIGNKYYVTESLVDGQVSTDSIEVVQITDKPDVRTWSVDKNTEHNCVVNIDFGEYLKGSFHVGVKFQGSSTLLYRKRNLRFTFYKDSTYGKKNKIKIGELVRTSGFNLKSNWTDDSKVKELIMNRIFMAIWEDRDVKAQYPWNTNNTPYTDATGMIKGFPVEVKIGGEFFGLNIFGLKKDEKNYMLNGDDDSSGIFVSCDGFGGVESWTVTDASVWADEMGAVEPMSVETTEALNNFFDYINGRLDVPFNRYTAHERMDVIGFIDYFICLQVFQMWDNGYRNMILYSGKDKKKFYPYMYDLDLSLNRPYNMDFFDMTNPQSEEKWDLLLWEKLVEFYWDEIVNRYRYLRGRILDIKKIDDIYQEVSKSIPNEVYSNESTKWGKNAAKTRFIQNEVLLENRLNWLDNYYFNV